MITRTNRVGPVLLVTALIGLGLGLGGCASYQPGRLPTAAELAPPEQCDPPVHKGSRVKVWLVDGTMWSGEVTRVDQDELVISKPGNYGLEEHLVRQEEIARLEVERSSKAGDALGSTVGVASIAFLALLVFLAIGISGG